MTYEKFVTIVNKLKKRSKILDNLYKNKVDLIDFSDEYDSIISDLLIEIYGEKGYDLFSWFCYELKFGKEVGIKNPRAWDKKGIVNKLKKLSKILDDLYKNKVDLIDFSDEYDSIISDLLIEIYGEEGYNLFSWFCYELKFGKEVSIKNPRAWDKKGNPICYNLHTLWDYLESNHKNFS